MKVNGKTIVVTGGGNGMGRSLVLQLLRKGASIAALDINQAALDETRTLAGDHASRLSLHLVNITDREAVEALPQQVIARHGQVDGIMNNAGIIQPFVKVKDLSYELVDKVVQVNFYGTLYMIKSFLPHLLERPEAHIVNTSSMGGFVPVPGQSIYGATKAAVKLLTEALYAELKETNVRVTVVFPGAIATNISANSGVDMSRMSGSAEQSSMKPMPADKAAEGIINAMENNKYRVCIGKDASMLDKLVRLNPKYATELIAKKMAALLK